MGTNKRTRLLLALVVLMPVLEIVVMVRVGLLVGPLSTVGLVLGLSLIGAAIMRGQGARAFRDARDAARSGRTASEKLSDRAVVFVGGVLLLLPGFITAVASVPFLLPPTRPLIRRAMSRWAVRQGSMYVTTGPAAQMANPTGRPDGASRFGPDVVRGEVVDGS